MNEKQTARFERCSEKCTECGGLGTITRYYGGGEFISTIDCDRCLGRGAVGNCTTCNGIGIIPTKTDATGKVITPETECPDCTGAGTIGNCPDCGGIGIIKAKNNAECPTCKGYGFVD